MRDPRINDLADVLVGYSCEVKPGDNVMIEATGLEIPLIEALIEKVFEAGAMPFVSVKDSAVQRAWLMRASDAQIMAAARYEIGRMQEMDAYIGVRGGVNATEMADVPADRMAAWNRLFFSPVHHDIRVAKTKWVVLRYPTPSMAQQAGMSTAAMEDFYFDVCTLDYAAMSRAMEPLYNMIEKASMVRIKGNGTDLEFSIQGIPVRKCDGHRNIPDGEVFTAPVRDSVNGCITYNTPSLYQGVVFRDIQLQFKDGKIVDCNGSDKKRIQEILATDEGASYVGEFAFGVNPKVNKPMLDTLFDEKIAGSFHFTPGSCYDDCSNGNHSAIHWDLVCIQTPEYGGGEIWLDDVLVRKDGLFVPKELQLLNP